MKNITDLLQKQTCVHMQSRCNYNSNNNNNVFNQYINVFIFGALQKRKECRKAGKGAAENS